MKELLELLLALFAPKSPVKKKASSPLKPVDVKVLDAYVQENVVSATETMAVEPVEISTIQFKDNSERLSHEFQELQSKNKELAALLDDLNDYVLDKFKKKLMITMIFRTDAEQDYLYRDDAKYAKKKFKSPHQFWHAVDLRSLTFIDAEIDDMVDYLNKKYSGVNFYKPTAMFHQVGSNGWHFHIQLVKP